MPTMPTWIAAASTRRIVPPTKLTSVAVSGVPTRWRSRPFVACCHAMPMPVSSGSTSIHSGMPLSPSPVSAMPTATRASAPPISRGTVTATTPAGP